MVRDLDVVGKGLSAIRVEPWKACGVMQTLLWRFSKGFEASWPIVVSVELEGS